MNKLSCVAPNCEMRTWNVTYEQKILTSSEYLVSFHQFPADSKRRQIWIKAIGNENLELTKESAICSLHFSGECYNANNELRPNAVPSIFFDDFKNHFKLVLEAIEKDEDEDSVLESSSNENNDSQDMKAVFEDLKSDFSSSDSEFEIECEEIIISDDDGIAPSTPTKLSSPDSKLSPKSPRMSPSDRLSESPVVCKNAPETSAEATHTSPSILSADTSLVPSVSNEEVSKPNNQPAKKTNSVSKANGPPTNENAAISKQDGDSSTKAAATFPKLHNIPTKEDTSEQARQLFSMIQSGSFQNSTVMQPASTNLVRQLLDIVKVANSRNPSPDGCEDSIPNTYIITTKYEDPKTSVSLKVVDTSEVIAMVTETVKAIKDGTYEKSDDIAIICGSPAIFLIKNVCVKSFDPNMNSVYVITTENLISYLYLLSTMVKPVGSRKISVKTLVAESLPVPSYVAAGTSQTQPSSSVAVRTAPQSKSSSLVLSNLAPSTSQTQLSSSMVVKSATQSQSLPVPSNLVTSTPRSQLTVSLAAKSVSQNQSPLTSNVISTPRPQSQWSMSVKSIPQKQSLPVPSNVTSNILQARLLSSSSTSKGTPTVHVTQTTPAKSTLQIQSSSVSSAVAQNTSRLQSLLKPIRPRPAVSVSSKITSQQQWSSKSTAGLVPLASNRSDSSSLQSLPFKIITQKQFNPAASISTVRAPIMVSYSPSVTTVFTPNSSSVTSKVSSPDTNLNVAQSFTSPALMIPSKSSAFQAPRVTINPSCVVRKNLSAGAHKMDTLHNSVVTIISKSDSVSSKSAPSATFTQVPTASKLVTISHTASTSQEKTGVVKLSLPGVAASAPKTTLIPWPQQNVKSTPLASATNKLNVRYEVAPTKRKATDSTIVETSDKRCAMEIDDDVIIDKCFIRPKIVLSDIQTPSSSIKNTSREPLGASPTCENNEESAVEEERPLSPRSAQRMLADQRSEIRSLEQQIITKERDILTLRKKIPALKKRCSAVRNPADTKSDEQLVEDILKKYLDIDAVQFFVGQMKVSGKSFTQFRWSEEDKLFALGLLYRNPVEYNMLVQRFTLPSDKTLNKFVHRIKRAEMEARPS